MEQIHGRNAHNDHGDDKEEANTSHSLVPGFLAILIIMMKERKIQGKDVREMKEN